MRETLCKATFIICKKTGLLRVVSSVGDSSVCVCVCVCVCVLEGGGAVGDGARFNSTPTSDFKKKIPNININLYLVLEMTIDK